VAGLSDHPGSVENFVEKLGVVGVPVLDRFGVAVRDIVRLVRRVEVATDHPTPVRELQLAVWTVCPRPAGEHAEQFADVDHQSGLLSGLSLDGFGGSLARFDPSAGDAPRLVVRAVLEQESPLVVGHDRTRADLRRDVPDLVGESLADGLWRQVERLTVVLAGEFEDTVPALSLPRVVGVPKAVPSEDTEFVEEGRSAIVRSSPPTDKSVRSVCSDGQLLCGRTAIVTRVPSSVVASTRRSSRTNVRPPALVVLFPVGMVVSPSVSPPRETRSVNSRPGTTVTFRPVMVGSARDGSETYASRVASSW
jgi:hypothetical protein